MKKNFIKAGARELQIRRHSIVFVLFTTVFFNLNAQDVFRQEGIASWYGREFEGRPTASGEIFDSSQFTAAHPTLPFGTMVVVTNQHNNKSVTVRINDRGPFVPARIIDVSRAAAEQLDMIVTGTAPVKVESIDRIAIVSDSAVLPVVVPAAPVIIAPNPALEFVSEPIHLRLTPVINIIPEKTYRLQIGSFKIARNAVNLYDKLKNSGLNPAYERFTGNEDVEYFRVVLAGIRGIDVQSTVEKLENAGFKEALIREEN